MLEPVLWILLDMVNRKKSDVFSFPCKLSWALAAYFSAESQTPQQDGEGGAHGSGLHLLLFGCIQMRLDLVKWAAERVVSLVLSVYFLRSFTGDSLFSNFNTASIYS